MERGKRGRLSSLNLLPEEAQSDVQWAYEEVKARPLYLVREIVGKAAADAAQVRAPAIKDLV